MARSVVENYDGNIPHDQKELMKLAGVGNKTANVFMIEYKQRKSYGCWYMFLEFLIDWDLVMQKNVEKLKLIW